MKFLAIVTSFLFCIVMIQFGASAKTSKSAKPANSRSKYSTDFNFNDLLVRGEYAQPAEAVAVVEDEKTLDDLLQVRKDFKDRLKQSSTKR